MDANRHGFERYSSCVRTPAALVAVAVAAGWLNLSGLAAARASSGDRVDVSLARAQPCSRVGIATSVMAFFGLLAEQRFYETRLLWLQKPRLPYIYLLWLNGGSIRTRRGSEVPTAVQRWMASGGSVTEVIAIRPRINREQPKASGFSVNWIRRSPDGTSVARGVAKGVWDCEKRRLGRLVGSERPVDSESTARAEAKGGCRGETVIRRRGQAAILYDLPRGAR